MIKVHCTSQEYWHIRKQKCECGGEFEVLTQALKNQEGTSVDVLNTRCKNCGIEDCSGSLLP
jgi:hypothetical protein